MVETWGASALSKDALNCDDEDIEPISHAFDYIEMDEATAKAAAEFALREKSGHSECSPNCKAWELLTRSLEL